MQINRIAAVCSWLLIFKFCICHQDQTHLSSYLMKKETAKSFLTGSRISKRSADQCVNNEEYCEDHKLECTLYTERSREENCRPDPCRTGMTCYMSVPCPAHYRTGCDANACLARPCKNGATCKTAGTTYTCLCTSAYYGTTCDYVDRCRSNPCINGGTCTRIGSDFRCGCTNEYQGTTCQHQSSCHGQPCENGATCHFVGATRTCTCLSGFYGDHCENVDRCLSGPCINGGTCTRSGSDFRCGCTNEYHGTTCQYRSPCYGQPCKNGATCHYVGATKICTCLLGFYGDLCENVDMCLSGPCINGGTCTRSGSDFRCGCTNEYHGTTCQYHSPCYGQPCKNGATCHYVGTTRTCTCLSGFYGNRCENVDKCLSRPCINGGTCTRLGSDFKCGCTIEYHGHTCQYQSPCYGQPCMNGATCQYVGATRTCTCLSGFYGNRCENVDKCLSRPCINGGTCTRLGSDFKCGCTIEYHGHTCQYQSPCYGQPCMNGATCQYVGATRTCTCLSGFYGDRCENVDRCLSRPCINGGTCTRIKSDFRCRCTNEYQGTTCQNQSPCFGQPCKNGATCRNAGATFTCICSHGFYGGHCENDDACLSAPCTNGATCNRIGSDYSCSCTERYTGSRCTKDCRPGPADIVIILDASSSANTVFNASKAFIATFVKGLSIDAGEFRIALLTYSLDAHLEFGFSAHLNKSTLLAAVDNVSNSSGPSHLHIALKKAREILRSDSVAGVKQYTLVLSDGLSTLRQEAIAQSRVLRADGVKVMCVGIGRQVAQEELLQIATDTPYVFSSTNNDMLNVVLMETVDTSCTDCVINKVSDIVLLVDVSQHQIGQLQRTLDIVKFFIQQVRAYFSNTRIAMVTFDVLQHVQFSLTDDQHTDSVLVHSQIGINTSNRKSSVSDALSFVRTSVLTGARDSSRKFVVVFSNEGWTDVNDILHERQTLNMDNVTVAFVPVGQSAELDTVYSVAEQASDVFYVGEHEADHDRLKALVARTFHVDCTPDIFVRRQGHVMMENV
ncbi:sushi, nidogen and EGF-like domain-containing protein 1 isoform X7 [Pecten maximus]|uniref:sushi, nidogen and EGF-like domain-containing protein 1 isoform X7 n=1 Tax=Pecten maximus TaxID=6579 RepID=UPI001457E620|nr:sushi, nidogen and EGF-like domain-containing protein 1 isoform X7 [Pecten maximus]